MLACRIKERQLRSARAENDTQGPDLRAWCRMQGRTTGLQS